MILPCRNPVHLYRSLLREASYLFDPAAQTFHANHIRWSFLRQRAKQPSPATKQSPDAALTSLTRQYSRQLKRARQYLYMLQRANQGYVTAIKNVLRMTYAGKGRQRRLLLNNIMTPLSVIDPAKTSRSSKYDRDWRPPEKFAVLLKNQSKIQSFLHGTNRKIKPIPEIPAQNRWKRPFPQSRIKGIMEKWYARHADLLNPPLQETQWLNVYQQAMRSTGQTRFTIPTRRPVGSVAVFTEPSSSDVPWIDNIDNLISTSALRPRYSKRIRSTIGNPHHMTNRFLRRVVQQAVLESTPTVIVDPTTGRSAFRRDSGVKHIVKPADCTESQQLSLFD